MTTLVFIGDIHNSDNEISNNFNNSGINIKKSSYALLLEVDMVDDGHIPSSEYDYVLEIICENKRKSTDEQLLKELMLDSNNNVYSFDTKGGAQSVSRNNGQRKNIQKIINNIKSESLDYIIVVVGDGHLNTMPGVQDWIPLQDTEYENTTNPAAAYFTKI